MKSNELSAASSSGCRRSDEPRIRQIFNDVLPEARISEAAGSVIDEPDQSPDDKFFVQPSKLGLAEK
jgi:hypothetical protein